MFAALVVENDRKQNSLYCSFLENQGYTPFAAHDAASGLDFIQSRHIDIVVCDALLPDADGITFVHAARSAKSELPIIMVSDAGDFQAKQRAFQAEIDDYMVKPVDLNELALRISAVLRRSNHVSKRRLVIGDAVLDSNTYTLVEGDTETMLPPKEFMILFKLCSSVGRIFTRREIMDDVWGERAESGERTVDVHIKRLRKRFERSKSFRIDTVRGVGYRVSALMR